MNTIIFFVAIFFLFVKNILEKEYSATKNIDYFVWGLRGSLWVLMDGHHLSNITKIQKKKHCMGPCIFHTFVIQKS